jgi:hypothetical protein
MGYNGGFMNACGLAVALNAVAFVALSAGLVVGMPAGLPLAAVGLAAWALARTQLKKC